MMIAPLVNRLGFPSIFANFLCVPIVIIPFQLGYLFIQSKKANHTISLKGIVLNREKLAVGQYLVIVPVLVLWSGLIFALISGPLDTFFINNVFYFLPEWFFTVIDDPQKYTRTALIVTWVSGILLNGIAAPVVEEIYFRGYLMPRLKKFGSWGPFVNVVLFSVYHFFSPWQNIERILAILPMGYAVWWKKNIYIGIFAHCLVNTISMLLLYNLFF